MKEKLKTTSFWLGLSGAVVIAVDAISQLFGVSIPSAEVESVIITICSILVMLGIVTKKNVKDNTAYSKDELLIELQEQQSDEDVDI